MRRTWIAPPIILMLLMLPSSSWCQEYYPLQTGNEWFYRSVNAPPGDSVSFSVRVLGDSLFPNGLTYAVLSQNDVMERQYVRADSTAIYYFTGWDQPVFRLNGDTGDTTTLGWGPYAYVRLSRIDTLAILGVPQRVLTVRT